MDWEKNLFASTLAFMRGEIGTGNGTVPVIFNTNLPIESIWQVCFFQIFLIPASLLSAVAMLSQFPPKCMTSLETVSTLLLPV
jgi:hypothetical protein